jgi:predicted DNA-binding WGR domain protein
MERKLHATLPQPRFWRIALEGLELVIRSGADGTPGAISRIPCKSPEAAQKTFDSLVAQRLKDGFVDQSAAPASVMTIEAERELLADDPQGWLVLADSLLETGDTVRGQLIGLQVKSAKRVRGSIGEAKEFIREHFDELVGSELSGFHTQVTLEWKFGYARSARIWSGPHTQPIGDVIQAVLNSPACRFLRQLEFGSPGTEGRYDAALRTLASLEWPAHLDSLVLGEFDVNQSFRTENAWPRIDSLLSLQPVAARLKHLEVRAALNTLGKGMVFPNLESFVFKPWRLDARLLTDLSSLETPKLRRLSFTPDERVGVSLEAWAGTIRRFIDHPGIKVLEVRRIQEGFGLLTLVGDALGKLERVVVLGAPASEATHLAPYVSRLKSTVFECPESVALAKALTKLGLKAEGPTAEALKEQKKKAAARERARAREQDEGDRYEDIVE